MLLVEAVSGIPPSRFIGKTHREMGFPEYLVDYWEAKIAQAFAARRPLFEQFTLPGPQGDLVLEWRLSPEFDWRQSGSLGMQLVSMLTEQIGGSLSVHVAAGTHFTITFPTTDSNRHPLLSPPFVPVRPGFFLSKFLKVESCFRTLDMYSLYHVSPPEIPHEKVAHSSGFLRHVGRTGSG